MISERMLRKWRRKALQRKTHFTVHPEDSLLVPGILEMVEQILRLTQELMDIHLLKKEQKL